VQQLLFAHTGDVNRRKRIKDKKEMKDMLIHNQKKKKKNRPEEHTPKHQQQ